MGSAKRSPAALRAMFGANLRQLSAAYPSISELARQLEVNRTQFNRYLSGESFPRPDVLDRICSFFGVDARVLLEPVAQIGRSGALLSSPYLKEYVGAGLGEITEEAFPSGFYRFSRRSFVLTDQFYVGFLLVRRDGTSTVLRGFEPRDAMALQNLPTEAAAREFRGLVMRQERGLVILAARRNAMTCSFNYLHRIASFENTFWAGYITRAVPESAAGLRAARLCYEFVGREPAEVLAAARSRGFCAADALPPFHRRLLDPESPFA